MAYFNLLPEAMSASNCSCFVITWRYWIPIFARGMILFASQNTVTALASYQYVTYFHETMGRDAVTGRTTYQRCSRSDLDFVF